MLSGISGSKHSRMAATTWSPVTPPPRKVTAVPVAAGGGGAFSATPGAGHGGLAPGGVMRPEPAQLAHGALRIPDAPRDAPEERRQHQEHAAERDRHGGEGYAAPSRRSSPRVAACGSDRATLTPALRLC